VDLGIHDADGGHADHAKKYDSGQKFYPSAAHIWFFLHSEARSTAPEKTTDTPANISHLVLLAKQPLDPNRTRKWEISPAIPGFYPHRPIDIHPDYQQISLNTGEFFSW
jgi:hypothetical protein